MYKRNCLAHHVTSHQRTVTVIMLKEWNKSGRNRCYLLWSNVHKVYLRRRNNREVCILTTLNDLTNEGTVVVQRSISLTDDMFFLFLCSKVNNIVVVEVYNRIHNLTVRSFNETEVVDLCIHTERRDKTNVWSFRALDRAETTVVCIVYVTNLETSTLTRQTTRTECRETTLVSYLSKWVCLIHEL